MQSFQVSTDGLDVLHTDVNDFEVSQRRKHGQLL